jgi:competence ComEA-like helix-hairpin-helix protein
MFYNENQEIKRGDVYYVRYDDEGPGNHLAIGRPAVIVSSQFGVDVNLSTVMVVYLTTNTNRRGAHYVKITSTQRPSLAKCNEICTINRSNLDRYLCSLNELEMKNIDEQMTYCLGLQKKEYVNDDEYEEETDNEEYIEGNDEDIGEIESLKVESEMWKRLYEKTMNQLVEVQFAFQLNSKIEKKKAPEKTETIETPKQEPKKSDKVNINTATKEEIVERTGLGEVTARYIVAYRNKHGKFKHVSQLMNIPRFGAYSMKKYGDMFEV